MRKSQLSLSVLRTFTEVEARYRDREENLPSITSPLLKNSTLAARRARTAVVPFVISSPTYPDELSKMKSHKLHEAADRDDKPGLHLRSGTFLDGDAGRQWRFGRRHAGNRLRRILPKSAEKFLYASVTASGIIR